MFEPFLNLVSRFLNSSMDSFHRKIQITFQFSIEKKNCTVPKISKLFFMARLQWIHFIKKSK